MLPDLNATSNSLQQEPPPRPDWLSSGTSSEARDVTEFVDEPAEVTEFLAVDLVGTIPRFPHPVWHPLKAAAWIVRTLFGLASLTLLLAVIAALPIVNFLALGYLLEVEGRLGRTGKLRTAFPLLGLAPRFGSIVLGVGLCILPLPILAAYAADARLIDPSSRAAAAWTLLSTGLAGLVAVHLSCALARGGGLGCFFRPIKNVRWLTRRFRDGTYWEHAAWNVREFVNGLRLRHHFSLGFRGFVGALAWLVIPTAIYGTVGLARSTSPGLVVLTVLGGICLIPVLAWLPFLQARFAAENRLSALFELRAVRELFTRAPIAWLVAIVALYVLTLPLYLLKVTDVAREARWFVTLVFIASIYPTKVMLGWAYHRAVKKTKQAWFGFRWVSRTLMLPLLAFYVFLLIFTPAIDRHGVLGLFLNHAFLLPVPF